MVGSRARWALGVRVATVGALLGACEEAKAPVAPLNLLPDSGTPTDGGTGEKRILRMSCKGENDLYVGDLDPFSAALAMGLCPPAGGAGDDEDGGDPSKWGLLDAYYVLPDGTGLAPDLAHGLLPDFGKKIEPQHGARMLALSSGTARRPKDEGYKAVSGFSHEVSSPTPAGFPVQSEFCDNAIDEEPVANDGAALELTIQAPAEAQAIRFNANFFTYEFPGYVCSTFNDFFVVLQDPEPKGSTFGNVAFDKKGNPISVNNAYIEVCAPQKAGGKTFACRLGTSSLAGTGFEGHGASGWLEVVSPVTPGSIFKLRFAIWDAGDHILDSTVLLDNFRFDIKEAAGPGVDPIDQDGAVPIE